MFRRRLFFIPILCLSSFAQAITTPEIAASALSPECVHYQIVGVCYWLVLLTLWLLGAYIGEGTPFPPGPGGISLQRDRAKPVD